MQPTSRHTERLRAPGGPMPSRTTALEAPTAAIEAAYDVYLLYANWATLFGLVVPMAGLGLLGGLAGYCMLRHWNTTTSLARSFWLPVACAVSLVGIRVLVHGEPVTADYVRDCPTWAFTLIIAQFLCLRRGFLQRFAIVMFIAGLPVLPALRMQDWGMATDSGEEVVRAAGAGTLSNANNLAFWFGFCCVAFGVLGLETRRVIMRVMMWLAAVLCLFVVGITVSRGVLVAVAIAMVIAFRRLLQRGFLPALLLAAVGGLVFLLGLFDRAAEYYSARGLEETGRLLVWPLTIQRFLEAPAWAVGVDEIATFVPGHDMVVTPHNAFLFLALAGGLVPLLLFAAYSARTLLGAWRAYRADLPDFVLILPLLVYVTIVNQTSNTFFMEPSFMIVSAAALQAADRRLRRAIVLRRPVDAHTVGVSHPPKPLAHAPTGQSSS